MRAGGSLSTVLGSALGGLLKSIARQGLSRRAAARALGLELEGLDRNEREFEAAMQFVRLAAEAARHLAEELMIAPSRSRLKPHWQPHRTSMRPLCCRPSPHTKGAPRKPPIGLAPSQLERGTLNIPSRANRGEGRSVPI